MSDTPMTDAITQDATLNGDQEALSLAALARRLERDRADLLKALVKIGNTANASIPTAKKLARISDQARAAIRKAGGEG